MSRALLPRSNICSILPQPFILQDFLHGLQVCKFSCMIGAPGFGLDKGFYTGEPLRTGLVRLDTYAGLYEVECCPRGVFHVIANAEKTAVQVGAEDDVGRLSGGHDFYGVVVKFHNAFTSLVRSGSTVASSINNSTGMV